MLKKLLDAITDGFRVVPRTRPTPIRHVEVDPVEMPDEPFNSTHDFAQRDAAATHLDALAGRLFRLPRSQQYVLRGSYLLHHVFRSIARPPHDIDLVASSETAAFRARAWILAATACDLSDGYRFENDVYQYDLYNYSSVPGVRYEVFGYSPANEDIEIEIDICFGESIVGRGTPISLKRSRNDSSVAIDVVTLEQSLAAKCRWLYEDARPEIKDLFDAWLISKHATLRSDDFNKAVDSEFALIGRVDFSDEVPNRLHRKFRRRRRDTISFGPVDAPQTVDVQTVVDELIAALKPMQRVCSE